MNICKSQLNSGKHTFQPAFYYPDHLEPRSYDHNPRTEKCNIQLLATYWLNGYIIYIYMFIYYLDINLINIHYDLSSPSRKCDSRHSEFPHTSYIIQPAALYSTSD